MAYRTTLLLCTLYVGLMACEEPPTSSRPSISGPAPGSDLSLDLPELTPRLLVASGEDPAHSGDGAALSEARDDDGIYEPEEVASGVYAAKTVPGFEPGYAYARGENWYSGNKGRVETTADLSYLGQHMGSQSAFSEGYELFLLDFGRWKFLSATARVYSGHECGQSVAGRSEHSAWWEFFTGMGVAIWGKTATTTAAPPLYQNSCAPAVAAGGGSDDSSTFACWYLLTYDLETGAVYEAELLYCDELDHVE
jgi:hypothetical protein